MTDGDGTTVSSATEEQERVQGQKLLSVARESAGPKILGRGTYCETHPYYASPFSYGRHA
jgi:hypothetical protein